jgi:hypothetical protein
LIKNLAFLVLGEIFAVKSRQFPEDGNVPLFVFNDAGYVPPPSINGNDKIGKERQLSRTTANSFHSLYSRLLNFGQKCGLQTGLHVRPLFIAYLLATSVNALANTIGTEFACPTREQIAKWKMPTGLVG